MSVTKKRIAVLISGGGSNLQALIDASKAPDYPAEIVLVISNQPDAYGLKRAEEAGIPTAVIFHKDFIKREAFDRALSEMIEAYHADMICLAGFMRVLSEWFVKRWDKKLLNIHPSLLPKFKGVDTHARALEAGDTEAGCTVHWVNAEVDGGEIIAQVRVPVLAGDTPEVLAKRVLEQEHQLYPQVLKEICSK